MDDENRQRLEKIAKEVETPVEELTNRFEKKLEEFEAKFEGLDSERSEIERHVINIIESESRNFGEGAVEGMPMLALGADFRPVEHFFTDGDAVIGAGIVNPEGKKPGLATILIDTADGVDMTHAIDVFQPLTVSRIHVRSREIGGRDNEPAIRKYSKPTYACESTGNTTLEIVDPADVSDSDPISELPTTRDEKREFLNEHFFGPEETITVQDVPTSLARIDDRGYPMSFGIDMKRLRGRIVDTYVSEEGDPLAYGNVTVIDDTIQMDEDVPAELVTDRQRIPGLNVSLSPVMSHYGEDSLVDFYGFVDQRRDTKTYRFNAFGAIPVIATPRQKDVEDEAETELI